jgi:hypothetical protein
MLRGETLPVKSPAFVIQEQVLAILNAGDNTFVARLQAKTIKTLVRPPSGVFIGREHHALADFEGTFH